MCARYGAACALCSCSCGGAWPRHPHDGREWASWDAQRAARAGVQLPSRAVLVFKKKDWAKYEETFKFSARKVEHVCRTRALVSVATSAMQLRHRLRQRVRQVRTSGVGRRSSQRVATRSASVGQARWWRPRHGTCRHCVWLSTTGSNHPSRCPIWASDWRS